MSTDVIDSDDIAGTVAAFLDDHWSTSALRRLGADRTGLPALWTTIGEMGWHDLAVPEGYGGLGQDLSTSGRIAEHLGEHLFPGPMLETIAAHHVLRPLGLVEESETPLTVAVAEHGSAGQPATGGTGLRGERLEGIKVLVPFADEVDVVVALVGARGGVAVIVGRPSATGAIAVEPLDFTGRPCDLDLAQVEVLHALTGPDAAEAADRLVRVMTLLSAWRLLGVANKTLTMTADYASHREQFGVPIATMQAIRHRLADMQMAVTTARNLCHETTQAVSRNDAAAQAGVRTVKAYCSRTARRVAEDAMQVHGGVAFTDEFDLHLYVRHALALQTIWGDERHHEIALGHDLIERRKGLR